MTTATTTFARTSTANSAADNMAIIKSNRSIWESQNVDSKVLVEILESQGRDSVGNYKRGFMGSLLQFLSSYGHLSEKQTAALRKIANEKNSQKEIVANTKSKHLGKKGDALQLEVSLDRKIKKYLDAPAFAGDNMVRHYFIMSDKAGNRVVYSGTSSRMSSMEEGKLYSLEVVVKDHYERDGEKQTYVFAAKTQPKAISKFSVKRTRKAAAKK